jgi:signal transduction histidine kinase
MSFLSGYKDNIRFWLKGYLFIGVAVLILGVLIYSNHLITRMQAQAEATTRLFARFVGNVRFEVDETGSLSLLQEVMKETNLPIIVTVFEGRPIAWHHVPVEPMTDEDFEIIKTMNPNDPPPGKISKLIELVHQYDRLNRPIPVEVVGMEREGGWIHYGSSPLERELRYMPMIQLGLFLVFMGVAIQGLRYLKLGEQRSIWVGMAKETAHQLGTPLSALLGWTQLLKDKVSKGRYDELEDSLQEMEVDLSRLSKVTERFSKIGSRPELETVEVMPVLERTVSYFHRRLPRLENNSTIVLKSAECPPIYGNEELLEWVFENLIKNGLDAIGDREGKIEISTLVGKSQKFVEIHIKDTGKGIPPAHRQQVFRPGFTTKQRGWGLGLALTRRIVEDYHNGSLKLLDTRKGKGTTFSVRLPTVV